MGVDDRSRDPGLAAVFSFFVTGAGQVYAGRVWLGFLWWLAEMALIGVGVYLYHDRYDWHLSRAATGFIGLWAGLVLLSKLLAVQHAELSCARGNLKRERAKLREALRAGRGMAGTGREARPWVMMPEAAPVAASDEREGGSGRTVTGRTEAGAGTQAGSGTQAGVRG